MIAKKISITALGVALYVVLSMTVKIPLIAHISLDLGYIVFAFYCYHFGAVSGMIVGGCGCVLISLITSGWFPPGWLIGNIVIGFICGVVFSESKGGHDVIGGKATIKILALEVATTIVSVFIGIEFIKTFVECALYSIPIPVKLISNGVAATADAIVMSIGVLFARRFDMKKFWR